MSPSQIRAFFAPGGAARHVAVLTLGTALAQLINIAATPALSRIYSPSEFGLFAVFMAVSALAATFITFRYETSILVPASDTEAARLVRLILLLIAVGAVLLGLFSICWSLFEQQLPLLTSIRQWLPLVFLVAGCTAVMSTVQAWLNREKRYLRMAQLRVVQSGTIALTALFMGIVWELPHGLLLAQAVACGVTTAAACWFLRSAANLWHPGNLRDVALRHSNAPKYLLPTALLDIATLQLPVILISVWFSESMAGQFSMAWRLMMVPMALIGASVGQVFMQRFSVLASDPKAARALLKKTWTLLFLMGALPLTLVYFFGEPLFEFLLGEDWREAGRLAVIMVPMILGMFLSSPTSGSYIVLNLQKYSLMFGVAVFVYRPFCLYIGYIQNDFILGVKLWVVFELIQIAIYQSLIWKKTGESSELFHRQKKA
jgi:O-antigen/teichoic acid export membrane protein